MGILGKLALGAVGYGCTSALLIKYPQLVPWNRDAERPKMFEGCQMMAHRGGAGENIENTMQAFRHALDVGSDMFEFDCQITKDGQVVIVHDDKLDRLSGVDKRVDEFNFKDLPLLNLKQNLEFDSSAVNTHTGKGTPDRKIPLLSEVFKTFPNVPMNIDVKEGSEELVSKIGKLLVEFDREKITAITNQEDHINVRCMNTSPNAGMVVSADAFWRIMRQFYTGVLPFVNFPEQLYEAPLPRIFLDHPIEYVPRETFTDRLRIRVVDWLVMSPTFINYLKRRGMHVNLYVANHPSEWERAYACGADSVMTDYPSKLNEWLKENPQYDRRGKKENKK